MHMINVYHGKYIDGSLNPRMHVFFQNLSIQEISNGRTH